MSRVMTNSGLLNRSMRGDSHLRAAIWFHEASSTIHPRSIWCIITCGREADEETERGRSRTGWSELAHWLADDGHGADDDGGVVREKRSPDPLRDTLGQHQQPDEVGHEVGEVRHEKTPHKPVRYAHAAPPPHVRHVERPYQHEVPRVVQRHRVGPPPLPREDGMQPDRRRHGRHALERVSLLLANAAACEARASAVPVGARAILF